MCSSTLPSCFCFLTPPNHENSSLTTSMYCNFDKMLQKLPTPHPAQTPILMILRVLTISSTFVWNAANWQTIDFTDDFYLFFPLCRALETGFDLHFCLKLSESNCSSLSCLKTPKNVKNCFNPYSFFTHLMKRVSLDQLALKGGTTLNQLPIGLHVKILNFNGRFEAYWAKFWMLSWYQSFQNRWKFNICFNFG